MFSIVLSLLLKKLLNVLTKIEWGKSERILVFVRPKNFEQSLNVFFDAYLCSLNEVEMCSEWAIRRSVLCVDLAF